MSDDPVRLFAAGVISGEVALARLLLGGLPPDALAARVAGTALAPLLARHRDSLPRIAALAREAEHGAGSLERIRAMFDRAVALSPEASVAVYSLGDPAVLAAATAEIVDWLQDAGLLGPERDALDLGTGIGRVAAALAPRLRTVVGLDVAPGMVAEAARRYAHLANLRFAPTGGADLAGLAAASFDLVLAVDSFPYLVDAGVVAAHVADAARVLRPGGALAILNLSYRGLAADARDATSWAARHGFRLVVAGARPFALWDGVAWLLQRP